ncbi:MAG: hypothetical protein WEB53_04575 [Akkermansiaceae bacterium]
MKSILFATSSLVTCAHADLAAFWNSHFQGVVSFHGSLDAAPEITAQAGKIPAMVLVLYGAVDPISRRSKWQRSKRK